MTKPSPRKATLTVLGVLTVMGLAVAGIAHAASLAASPPASSEPDLLGGPSGAPVGKPKPAAKPTPIPSTPMNAPLAPRVDRPRVPSTEMAQTRMGQPPVIDEPEEEPAPPVVARYRSHAPPDDHALQEMRPSEEAAPEPDLEAPAYANHEAREDYRVSEPPRTEARRDDRVADENVFARLEGDIARSAERGMLGQRQAMMLYAELDDIAAQRDYYSRTRGFGPQERAIVDRRLNVLEMRIARGAAAAVPYRRDYRY
jgi:hypothetical protein